MPVKESQGEESRILVPVGIRSHKENWTLRLLAPLLSIRRPSNWDIPGQEQSQGDLPFSRAARKNDPQLLNSHSRYQSLALGIGSEATSVMPQILRGRAE
jgi:hypothetical protein